MGIHTFVVAVSFQFLRHNSAIYFFTGRKVYSPIQKVCFIPHDINISDVGIKPEVFHHRQTNHPVFFVKHSTETPQNFLTRASKTNQNSWPDADPAFSSLGSAKAFCRSICLHHGFTPKRLVISVFTRLNACHQKRDQKGNNTNKDRPPKQGTRIIGLPTQQIIQISA